MSNGVPAVALCALMAGAPGRPSETDEVLVPPKDADHSAYRVDTEVFGWNKKFTEMAALGHEIRRTRDGAHRGEAFLLVFDVDSFAPKENVHVAVITQGANRRNPLPLAKIRDTMWHIDWQFQRMWPRRPRRKHYGGAMKVDPLSDIIEIGAGVCRPYVGMTLRYKGQVRYLEHQPMDLKASCPTIRQTNQRTYWGKKDLAAVMIRYDYSPNDNEQSVRFALSASWEHSRALSIGLATAAPDRKVTRQLEQYGVVKKARGPVGGGRTIRYNAGVKFLAHRLSRELRAEMLAGEDTEGFDLLVSVGSGAPEPRMTPTPAEPLPPAPTSAPAPEPRRKSDTSYLDDFTP